MVQGKYAIDILNRRQNGSIEIKLLFPLVTLVWKYPTEIHLLFLSAKVSKINSFSPCNTSYLKEKSSYLFKSNI